MSCRKDDRGRGERPLELEAGHRRGVDMLAIKGMHMTDSQPRFINI